MKKHLTQKLEAYLKGLGFNPQLSEDADLSVEHTFLDKAWLGGKRQIDYTLKIGVDAQKKQVLALEQVLDQSSGFSFGFSTRSFSQSGTKVYRKVKAKQTGIDGKTYSIDLDLGKILKGIESVAEAEGYGFREVITTSSIAEAHTTED